MIPAIIAAGVGMAGYGAYQRSKGASGVMKAEQELKSNPYLEDPSITDYYGQIRDKAAASPEASAAYKTALQNINRITSGGLKAAQDRRGGLAVTSTLARKAQDAALNANISAGQQQKQYLGMLGSAAQMRMGERTKAYKMNVLDPFNRKYNMESQRMAEGNAMISGGARNIISGLGALSSTKKEKGGGGNDAEATT